MLWQEIGPRVDVLERSRLRLQFGFVFKKNVQYIINIIRIEHTIKDENTKQMSRMYSSLVHNDSLSVRTVRKEDATAKFPIMGTVLQYKT